jgi:hypothetical protein
LVSNADRSGIASRTAIANRDIVNTGGESETSCIAQGGVEIACVELERTDTQRCVSVARYVVKERTVAYGRVVVAGRVELKCLVTIGRVIETGSKAEEGFVTLSRVFSRIASVSRWIKFCLAGRPKRKAGKRDEEKDA